MGAKRFVEIHEDKGNLTIKEDLQKNSKSFGEGYIVQFSRKLEDELQSSARINEVQISFLSLDDKGITTARIYDESN